MPVDLESLDATALDDDEVSCTPVYSPVPTAGAGGVAMDREEILRVLPHRPPFLLLDRLLAMEPGEWGVGEKDITPDEPCFAGHFPGHPIFPGVLILEMMAQTACAMLLVCEEHRGKRVYLAGVEKARFRQPVLPGDTLQAEARLVWMRGGVGRAEATARVGGRTVCTAEICFAAVEPDR